MTQEEVTIVGKKMYDELKAEHEPEMVMNVLIWTVSTFLLNVASPTGDDVMGTMFDSIKKTVDERNQTEH